MTQVKNGQMRRAPAFERTERIVDYDPEELDTL
jgi:hypothetical protein